MEVREKILRIASVLLNVEPTELTIEDGKIYVVKEPSRSISLRRIAGLVHWNPNSLNVEGDVSLYSTKTFHIQLLRLLHLMTRLIPQEPMVSLLMQHLLRLI